MSNNFFRFKQFTIYQDRCAMKVSTDACIQGAWTPVNDDVQRVLDIGTGTGLLALMLTQKKNDTITDAIELDEEASAQAKENIAASAWADRVHVINGDVTSYPLEYKYDLVISNPPFFNNSLLGDRYARNNARHTLTLSYRQLVCVIADHLSENGVASVLLPMNSYEVFEEELQAKHLSVYARFVIHPRVEQNANRVVVLCSRSTDADIIEEHLYIRKEDGNYTDAYKQLLSPYYLDR